MSDDAEEACTGGEDSPRTTLEDIKSRIATTYYMDGVTFSKHANYATNTGKERPITLQTREATIVCLMVLETGETYVGGGKNRDDAYADCLAHLVKLGPGT